MKPNEFLKKTFENSEDTAIHFTINRGDFSEVFQNIFDDLDEMWSQFEGDPANTCDDSWREGYVVEVYVFKSGDIHYTAGISLDDIPNQPPWIEENFSDLDEKYLEGLFKVIQIEIENKIKGEIIMLKQKQKQNKEMYFHNKSEGNYHNIYEIIEYNTGIEAKCVGYNRGKKVFDLEGKLYKLTQFDIFNNESWVTLKEYKGKTRPKFYNSYQEEKIKNDEYIYRQQGNTDHFLW